MNNTSMLDSTRAILSEQGVFDETIAPVLASISGAIPFSSVPEKMKLTIAASEIITFASQFRRNIVLKDGTSVPINAISMLFTDSGNNKDSSVRSIRKCFSHGYKLIEDTRNNIAHSNAIEAAASAGEDMPEEWSVYKKYYTKPPPIFLSPTTSQGLVRHSNDLNDLGLSASLIYTGEFSDQLAHGENMVALIEALSELYDLGEKEAKYTQGAETRSEAISGQPVSALFIGSPGYILYDEATKRKFNIAFMSKLARRSWFCFAPERIANKNYHGDTHEDRINAMLQDEEAIEDAAIEARSKVASAVQQVTEWGMDTSGQGIRVSDDVNKLFKIYKRYNEDLSNTMPNPESAAVLVRRHLQWKALKLAGALAIFDLSNTIDTCHYIAALQYCEVLSEDMAMFELVLSKLEYEKFADYIKTTVNSDGEAHMTIHELKKRGFITSTARTKLQEFIAATAAYDKTGTYTLTELDTIITYKAIQFTDDVSISYKAIDNTRLFNLIDSGAPKDAIKAAKAANASQSNTGLKELTVKFEDLSELLEGDFAYSPFLYKDQRRNADSIISGTKVLVFDLDDSDITYNEAHFMLSDINHHISLGSDASNEFKFRVIIELDSVITLDSLLWKHFYTIVATSLGLNIDVLAQSSLFFSYGGREVLSATDGSPLAVRDYLMQATERASTKTLATQKLSTAHSKALLDDELTTFSYCFECPLGESGGRSMIRMVRHAKDLGASIDEAEALVRRANVYWIQPYDDDVLEREVLSQLQRIYSH